MGTNDLSKLMAARRSIRVRCKKCGWGRMFLKHKRLICKNCGSYVFKNDREEFRYRVKERLNKYEREERNNKNNT